MNMKKLLVPFAALSLALTGCFGPDPVNAGWDSGIKNSMQQEFGVVVPYVSGLDYPDVTFQENKVLKVSAFLDDFNDGRSFAQSYDTKLGKAGFKGDYQVVQGENSSIYGHYSHTTDKTIVVAEETISELLWVDIDIYAYDDDAYTIDLIAYLSGDFASFPLDSLCELIEVASEYKTNIPAFSTASGTNFRIKGYVPGDIFYYVIATDSSDNHTTFTTYDQALTEAGFAVQSDPEELKGTAVKSFDGMGRLEVHYYEIGNYFYGGFTLLNS